MNVHVFNCPECKELWSLPERYLNGDPATECKKCGGSLRHGTTEATA